MDNIIIYNTDDGTASVKLYANDGTVWLARAEIAALFQKDRSTISKHIKNIFAEGELDEKNNVHFLHIDNSKKPVAFRNVHEIIETYSPNFSKVMDLIAYLNEEDIDLQELENFLLDFMKQQPDIFKTPENSPLKTNFRRLIRIYDWLKYGRK